MDSTMVLSDKQKKFVEIYFELNNGTKAAIMAGYGEKGAHAEASRQLKNVKVRGYLEELQKERRVRIQNRLATIAEKAVEMLFDLAVNGESENVRLSAIKDILDRSGYKATDKIEQKNEHSGKITFGFIDPAAVDS
ncbi:terminase small subunit [Neobacillus niacini]|uniref:terminase small subunit n=1 Tax=Neobacillus niacini TaxID=86668 RepID=UPI0039830A29